MATCPSCGERTSDSARFCPSCGAALLPSGTPHEERKVVSVLFVDLVGFTSRSDGADPEDVRDRLQLYHSLVKQLVEEYGGTVEKFIGDAVMTVFGAPLAHDDDAERAVRAGLRVLDAIEDLNAAQQGLGLAARAAVNTGEAMVSLGSGHQTGAALAIGDVVNTASRLQTAAPPGRLIVGTETYLASRQAIHYEELAAVDAKGKRDPVSAWLAVEPTGAPAERQMTTAPMVGRDHEMSLLTSIWDHAVTERRPHLVTVIGPPGIGKSRLSREFSAVARRAGGRVVRGRSLPYGTREVFGAFAQQVKQVAGIFEDDAAEPARDKLAGALADLLPDDEVLDATRSLSLLMGLGLDAQIDERVILFFCARRLVEQLGRREPTLLVFEDIHWADAGQLDLLEYLAAHLRETSVVLLAMARPELVDVRPTFGGGMLAQTTIVLEPLSSSESATIASHILGGAPSASIDRLVEIAEGNPLFVEELTAALASGVDPGAELPTTVRAAIASRIDAIPSGQRAVLLDASVVGRTFWRGVIEAMGQRDPLDDALEALEARDLIRRAPSSSVRGDTEYSFKHILIRDVAYGTLPRAQRRTRHAAVARYIEDVAGEQVRDLAWLLAHHWREAGDPSRAIDYLLLAAERAREALATDDVVELYAAALELASDDRVRTRILLARGLALVKLEEFQRADEALRELIPELDGLDELEAVLARTRATYWTEQTDETLALSHRAIELAERLDARDALAPATARLAEAYAMRGDPGDLDRALQLSERAAEIWVPGARTADLAEHSHLFADIHYWTGDYPRVLELSQKARAHAVEASSAEARLRGGGMYGLTLCAMGRYEEALAIFEDAIALGRDLGRPVRVPLNYSTAAFRELQDFAEARRRSEEALEQAGWAGFQMPRMNSLVDLVVTDLLEGRIGKAEAAWPRVWDEVRAGKAWERWLLTGKMMVVRAELALAMDDPDTAANWAGKAIDTARSVRRRKYESAGRMALGQALLAMKKDGEAIEELRTALEIADGLGSPQGRWQTRAALATALYATGADDAAGQAAREAAEIVRSVAAELKPARADRFLAAEEVHAVVAAGG